MCAGRTNEGERCSVRPDRDPTAEARSPPARSACFSHPVQMSQRGMRAAAVKACLVIYKTQLVSVPLPVAVWYPNSQAS